MGEHKSPYLLTYLLTKAVRLGYPSDNLASCLNSFRLNELIFSRGLPGSSSTPVCYPSR